MAIPVYPANPILLVDDEIEVLDAYKMALRMSLLNNLDVCQDSRAVASLLAHKPYAAAVLDLSMPHVTGRELLQHIKENYPHMPVIIVTGTNEVNTAVECMKEGAYDYMLKPVNHERLVAGIVNALELNDIKSENEALKSKMLDADLANPQAFNEIITVCAAMKAIFRYIEAIACTTHPILITGESGTGKELFAKAIHAVSGRKGKFVAVNVGGLDDTVFSDTLFGHKKGAFTGADGDRPGLIEEAAGGTLFLDEIGSLEMQTQIKLLRLLQEKQFYPLGSDTHKTGSAAIVAATNGDLHAKMRANQFRNDLFYRLNTHHIAILPLRERIEDVPFLADYFVSGAAKSLGKKIPEVAEEIIGVLAGYSFPGNVRELQSLLFDATSRSVSGHLDMDLIEQYIRREAVQSGVSPGAQSGSETKIYYFGEIPKMEQIEGFFFNRALKLSNGNQSVAARMLGVSQATMCRRMKGNPET
jgi:DNA-binding NtrC family response regulator